MRLFVVILVAVAVALQIVVLCIDPMKLLPIRLITLGCMVAILILNIRRCISSRK